MLQDFQYAFRNLRKSPLFTSVALLSLALGIGANSAIFTIADQVLLRLLPVRHARELLQFTSPGPQMGMVWGENLFSHPMFRDFQQHNEVFQNIGARFGTQLNLSYNNRSDQISAEIVSGSYFDTLGLGTAMGRGLTPDDDRVPGGHSVVVLTYDYWKTRFGGDPGMLNKVVRLNGHPMTVIGVTARGYRGFDVGSRVDALVPIMMKAQMTPTWNGLTDRRVIWLQVIGRLRQGITVQQARASLEPYYRALLRMETAEREPRSERSRRAFISKPLIFVPAGRGVSDFRTQFAAPLRILLGIVGLLLLIACANVANLLLARAVSRQKEIAVRLAMGASRLRLMRQLVVESVVLSLGGAVLGLLFAVWTTSGLLALLANAPTIGISANPDWRVFLFTFALAVATGVIFGLIPAWQATSPRLAGTLKEQGGNVSVSAGHVRLRKVLVTSQVALSLVMLIAATLFARSLHNLRNVDLGFERQSLMAFNLDPSLNAYSPARIRDFAANVRQRVAAIPGVRSAAVGVNPVVGDNMDMSTVKVEGYQPKEDENMNPQFDAVSPGYFATLGIPLLVGREFTDADRLGSPRVAVVNEAFAKYFFHNENPIGRRFGRARDKDSAIEIVGVARNSKYTRVDEKTARMVYLAFAQEENPSSLVVYARTAADPKGLFAAVGREVRGIDASVPVIDPRTMEEQVDESLSAQRLIATLSGFFAVLATVLAAIGLYGVMAYTVERRTREIGIRVALGAGRSNVLGLVLREVAILTGAGVLVAVPAALALAGLVRAQLYGVVPNDPLSMGAAAAALIAVALLAGYIPAERATRVSPISALRYE